MNGASVPIVGGGLSRSRQVGQHAGAKVDLDKSAEVPTPLPRVIGVQTKLTNGSARRVLLTEKQ